ncbi:hypothetical protein LTS18_000066 [Coniosporium uncinatum]|uniref:Uncharacterized protein n=1 Tax=Coniosporium uncinatum TaxID=93489 RepID=A0ACC3DDC7_9PEZI|nr:hypothetical protein LTS18_000066 [Coniosporium uncinatum]
MPLARDLRKNTPPTTSPSRLYTSHSQVLLQPSADGIPYTSSTTASSDHFPDRGDDDIELHTMHPFDSSANAPLLTQDPIPDSPQQEQNHDDYTDHPTILTDPPPTHEPTPLRPTPFLYALTLSACISGLLFGYDTGIISSTLVSISTDLSARALTTWDKSLITSCTSLAALFASPLAGLLADALGRKRVVLVADALFVGGAGVQALASTVGGMIAGRVLVGLAVGAASFVVPLYVGEVAPAAYRGRLVTVSSLFITGGQVVAYVVGWGFSGMERGWRWMVGLGMLPAVLQVGLMAGMAESPRWLVKVGRSEEARRVLTKVYGGGKGERASREVEGLVEGVLRRVEREVSEEEEALAGRRDPGAAKSGWRAKIDGIQDGFVELVAVGAHRRALVIACMLQGFQQLCGFNSLMYFSATIFSLVGFRSPTLTSLSIALTNFAFTLVAFYAIDRLGRRRILLLSIPIMVLGLALCAFAFRYVDLDSQTQSTPSRSYLSPLHLHRPSARLDGKPLGSFSNLDSISNPPSGGGGGGGGGRSSAAHHWPLLILASMTLYVAGYAVGLGTVPWQQSELFPLPVRALGSSLATSTNWLGNAVVGATFLPMMEALSPSWTFAAYAGVCAVCWCCVWNVYPETAGLGLEDVGGLLARGWGVGESVTRWKHRRRRGG